MKDLKPKGKKKDPGPTENQIKIIDASKVEDINNLTPEELAGALSHADGVEEFNPSVIPGAKEIEEITLDDVEFTIKDDQPQDTEYLKENSEEKQDALNEAELKSRFDIFENQYGSTEWKPISRSENTLAGYFAYCFAMAIGNGNKGVIIKNIIVKPSQVAIDTLFVQGCRIEQDPKDDELYILR